MSTQIKCSRLSNQVWTRSITSLVLLPSRRELAHRHSSSQEHCSRHVSQIRHQPLRFRILHPSLSQDWAQLLQRKHRLRICHKPYKVHGISRRIRPRKMNRASLFRRRQLPQVRMWVREKWVNKWELPPPRYQTKKAFKSYRRRLLMSNLSRMVLVTTKLGWTTKTPPTALSRGSLMR